jgi:hypothetical protein
MENNEKAGKGDVVFNMEAVPILQLLFENCAEPSSGDVPAKTACVKFMLTMQDEAALRELGYSQEQIDKFKPQDAAEIILARTKARIP